MIVFASKVAQFKNERCDKRLVGAWQLVSEVLASTVNG